MSQTILLSEVNEVAGRYPEIIEQIRATLAGAQLPISGEPALHALTDRLQDKPLFHEDLHEALNAALAPVSEITQLEALAVLVHAAVGTEHALALTESDAADVPLRALFKFVLASRRRSRETAVENTTRAPQQQHEPAKPRAYYAPEQAFPAPTARRAEAADRSNIRAAAPFTEAPERELLTASAPGDFGMLGRALAFAADQEPPPRKAFIPDELSPAAQVLSAAAEPATQRSPRMERRTERMPLWSGPVAAVPVAAAVADVTDDEEEREQSPRRWGMGTAVMCGVLMGFAVGAFVHFDHKTPAVAIATMAPAAAPNDNGSKGRVKSVEELSAEIAALDKLANAPAPGADAAASRPDAAEAPTVTSRRATRLQPRQPAHRDYVPLPPAQDQQPAVLTRSAAAGKAPSVQTASTSTGASAATMPAASTMVASVTSPAPLVNNTPSASVFHTASSMHLPHVVTGSAGIMAANLISSPAPAYPAAASAAGVQGEVVVEAVVGRGGEVVGTRVVSGPLLLRTAALEAVQHWHYRPYEVDGKPVEVATTARVEFRLDQ